MKSGKRFFVNNLLQKTKGCLRALTQVTQAMEWKLNSIQTFYSHLAFIKSDIVKREIEQRLFVG